MPRTPSTPPQIDGYIIDRLIGSGGFADVFISEQELPRRKVAVKALVSSDLSAAARAAFTSEAHLMARLSTHPHIVTIYQVGVARDGRPYLVMEYCSRPSLAERYKRQPLSVADALRTAIRISGAVATAHAANILHRDIKPGNVLTNDYGWPALTDFGIASEVGDVGRLPIGDPQNVDVEAGTGMSVPWSPPEMFDDIPRPDVRSDVFSLAATIHTVLAGRSPFEVPGGPNGTLELIGRIESGDLTPLTRGDVPASVVAALARGMSPRREDRYPSAIDFARTLQRIELELGYAATTIELPILDDEPDHGSLHRDGEETSIREVRYVIAQADTAASAVSGHPALGDAVATASDHAPLPLSGPPRRRLVGLVVGGLAVLAMAVIVLSVLGADPGSGPAPTIASPVGSTGGSAVGSSVPQAAGGSAVVSADGTAVVFAWTNPSPTSDDIYYWARSENPSNRQATRTATASVGDIVPGSRVCINVEIGRAGATGKPFAICTAG